MQEFIYIYNNLELHVLFTVFTIFDWLTAATHIIAAPWIVAIPQPRTIVIRATLS